MIARLRTFLVAASLVGYILIVGPPTLLVTWLSGSAKLLYRLGVPAVRFAVWLGGIRMRVVGLEHLENGRSYLFMPNHRSNVDAPVVLLALRRDVRMMAKAELFRIPLLGQALHLAGFVPVVRQNRERAIASVEEAASCLRAGLDFVVFPEGTRSHDGDLLPLKKGPFFMAVGSGVPIVPVVIRGTRPILPKGSPLIRGGEVDVEILEPIETSNRESSCAALRDALREEVSAALRRGLTRTGACATQGEAAAAGVGDLPS